MIQSANRNIESLFPMGKIYFVFPKVLSNAVCFWFYWFFCFNWLVKCFKKFYFIFVYKLQYMNRIFKFVFDLLDFQFIVSFCITPKWADDTMFSFIYCTLYTVQCTFHWPGNAFKPWKKNNRFEIKSIRILKHQLKTFWILIPSKK